MGWCNTATTQKIMPQGKSQDVLCHFVVAPPLSSCHNILCSINLDSKLCRRRFASISPSHVLIAKFFTVKVSIFMGTRVRVLNIVACSTMDVTGLPSLILQLIPFYVC